jgi:cytosine permease
MQAVDLQPVPPSERTQPALDLFLIFAGANIVATTLITGASLVGLGDTRLALALIAIGSVAGAWLVAALAPVGTRLGVPSMVAARAALGTRGAAFLAMILYVTNFAWIAVNNLIAASALARATGGPETQALWVQALGLVATLVVLAGPRAVSLADRIAVPLMLFMGAVMTLRFLGGDAADMLAAPAGPAVTTALPALHWLTALDVVVGYQVSWILMFADYSRFTPSPRSSFWAVLAGLALSSAWFMPLGLLGARAAGSSEPGLIVGASGLGLMGALLLALATLTTNFVNIYLSALAFKSLLPGTSDALSIAAIGTLGTLLALIPGAGLERYVDFMLLLGGLLVPVGGVLLQRFVLSREPVSIPALYARDTSRATWRGWRPRALTAWAAGAAVYFAAQRFGGGTLPALVTALALAALLERFSSSRGDTPSPA